MGEGFLGSGITTEYSELLVNYILPCKRKWVDPLLNQPTLMDSLNRYQELLNCYLPSPSHLSEQSASGQSEFWLSVRK